MLVGKFAIPIDVHSTRASFSSKYIVQNFFVSPHRQSHIKIIVSFFKQFQQHSVENPSSLVHYHSHFTRGVSIRILYNSNFINNP